MASRLPVVLSQCPVRNVDRQQLEEQLVGGLLMEDGVEVTVIVDLEDLDEDETGLLCLEGIGGDWILLSWNRSREAHQKLLEKGIGGRFGETRFSTPAAEDVELRDDGGGPSSIAGPTASLGGGRRIFHMDLGHARDASSIRTEIAELREAMSIKTLNPFEGLGQSLSSPSGNIKPAAGPSSSSKAPSSAASPVQPPTQPAKSSASAEQSTVIPSYDDDDDLDELLDQLDELD